MDQEFKQDFENLTGSKLTEPEDREDVRKILEFLRMRNGFLDDEDEAELQSSQMKMRRKMQFVTKNQRKTLALHTTSISNQIYTHPFHFLYEVIQNADDADYSKTDAPSLKLTIREKDLLIDLNEDGFTLANVIAICSTGESSKKDSESTTGEKGYGFKAVFGIASEVQIQSGIWSFAFKHEQHEDGIGMVSPTWREPSILPAGVRTRFTLTYSFHNGTDLQGLCAYIREQPVTIVSFLRRLRRIDFLFDKVCGDNESISFAQLPTLRAGKTLLAETRNGVEQIHYFEKWQRIADDMPARAGRRGGKSTILMQFPVLSHENPQPRIESRDQHVFAYLPINKILGLPFIIQADFMLPASRQDIIEHLDWNRKLREHTVNLFVSLACQWASSQEGLRYSWLKFLPRTVLPGFWAEIPGMLVKKLKASKAFLSMAGSLHYPHELRIVPECFMHDNEPLLANRSIAYTYLSSQYDSNDYARLTELGVSWLTSEEMLESIIADAGSLSSRLHGKALTDAWQEKYGLLLKSLLTGPYKVENAASRLQKCRIFPLCRDCRLAWGNLVDTPVYLPKILDHKSGDTHVQIYVPTDLGITTIHRDAVRSTVRREVYTLLKVLPCPATTIRDAILAAHKRGVSWTPSNPLEHLELLFWFKVTGTPMVKAMTEDGQYQTTSALFFQSSKEYDAELAVGLHDSNVRQKYLLALMYQDSNMQSFLRNGKTWIQWLEQITKIRWYPQLQDQSAQDTLHWTIRSILKNNPEKFLPLLQAHWTKEYAETCRYHDKVQAAVLDAEVPCIGGSKVKLRDTFFPTQEILEVARTYHAESSIGIVDLPDASKGLRLDDWPCLRDLGIQSTANLSLYKKILATLAKPNEIVVASDIMANLYKSIAASASLEHQKELQILFSKEKLVWDPRRLQWLSTNDCVWNSKAPLTQMSVLTSCYDAASVKNLFVTLLELRDSKIDDFLNELKIVRQYTSLSSDQMLRLATRFYEVLSELAISVEDRQRIKSSFKEQQLIFHDGSWLRAYECVWHESVSAGGHVPIKESYSHLQDFFVRLLNVNKVDAIFMMKQLEKAAKRTDKDVAEIKKLMMGTSTLLCDLPAEKKSAMNLEWLQSSAFLPGRLPSGDLKWKKVADDFFIPDDDVYSQAFRPQACMLDITYVELNTMHPLLSLFGLESKYLRNNVTSQTKLGHCVPSDGLTKWLRECAFALSSCAVFHHSPLYANKATSTHDLLRNAEVQACSDMHVDLVAKGCEHGVPTEQVPLVVSSTADKFLLIMPESQKEQKICKQFKLPEQLMKELGLTQPLAMAQIQLIINDLSTGTDDILKHYRIPPPDWLVKTERIAPPTPPETPTVEVPLTPPSSRASPYAAPADAEPIEFEDVLVPSSGGQVADRIPTRSAHVPIPPVVNHIVDAPNYHYVLDHAIRQAAALKWRKSVVERTQTSTYEALRGIATSSQSQLFGKDAFVKHRIGAAGELFAFEVLKSILGGEMSLQNWPSSIRHFVRALTTHNVYGNIAQWHGAETSDLIYTDETAGLSKELKRLLIGDVFEDWLPEWLVDKNEPLEWFFEVKTTLGACNTPFFMSQSQHSRMRRAGTATSAGQRQVYCIVRVYDLLSANIGLRLYIDPWRLRDTELTFDTTEKWRVTATRQQRT